MGSNRTWSESCPVAIAARSWRTMGNVEKDDTCGARRVGRGRVWLTETIVAQAQCAVHGAWFVGQPSTGKCTAVRSLGPVLARTTCYCIPFHPTYRDLALPLNTESVNLTAPPLSVGLAAAAGPRPCSCVRTWLALIEAAAERWILGAADLLLVALGHSFSLLLLPAAAW